MVSSSSAVSPYAMDLSADARGMSCLGLSIILKKLSIVMISGVSRNPVPTSAEAGMPFRLKMSTKSAPFVFFLIMMTMSLNLSGL